MFKAGLVVSAAVVSAAVVVWAIRARRTQASPMPAAIAPTNQPAVPTTDVIPVVVEPQPAAPVKAPPAETPAPNLDAMLRRQAGQGMYSGRVRMADYRAKLELSDDERDRLIDAVIDFKQAAAVLEAPLLKVVSFDGESLVLESPAHPVEGETAKQAFVAEIRKQFAPDKAERIAAAAGTELAPLFEYFGQMTVTYTVERPRPDNQIHVITRATATNPDDPPDRRRAEAISGAGWMSRELLDFDHPVLVKAVDAHFQP